MSLYGDLSLWIYPQTTLLAVCISIIEHRKFVFQINWDIVLDFYF